MVQTALKRGTVGEPGPNQDEFIKACQLMLLARVLDDQFARLYRMGKIHGGVFLGRGQEALSAAFGLALRPGDIFAPLIRDAAGRLAFGESVLDAVRTFLGSPLGPMRGRDGNVHRGRPSEGLLPMISHLGAMIAVVNGGLFAHRCKGIKGTVGLTCIGEGGTSTGAWHEALNQAAVEKLPLVLVVANNHYAYSTPNARQFACASLLDRAAGYGVASHELDGTNLWECLQTAARVVRLAREGAGPQLVVANLLRLCGHGEHDDAGYVDPRLKASPVGRDCVEFAAVQLAEHGWGDAATFAAWREESSRITDRAIAQVQREASPDPYNQDWCALSVRHLAEGAAAPEGAA